VISPPIRDEIVESDMQSEEGEFEVLNAHETVKPKWMKGRVNLLCLQPIPGPALVQPMDLSVIKQEASVGTQPLDLSAAIHGPDLVQPSDLSAMKQEVSVGAQPLGPECSKTRSIRGDLSSKARKGVWGGERGGDLLGTAGKSHGPL
jgi:hypothetical protein